MGNRFEDAGERGINIGGSTGLRFFRPPLPAPAQEALFEARDIRVEGNTFTGGMAPVAFINVDGAVVRFNTISRPRRWLLRILTENTSQGFGPSRRCEFTDNIVAFRSDEIREAVNIGRGTEPGTFKFARNFWYCLDRPERSRPRLPSEETGGVYGNDPLFVDPEKGDLGVRPESPARAFGAGALKQPKKG